MLDADFDRVLAKAVAELNAARARGPQHAMDFLVQARYHVNLAIDHAKLDAQKSGPARLQELIDLNIGRN